jgi:DNA-binding NtrC family response regulator
MKERLPVLIASANQSEQQALASVLCRCGFEPLLSSTVEEAGKLVTQTHVCLVFCDEALPDGDYVTILEEVERSPQHCIPVIVFSRLGDWEKWVETMRKGAFDLIAPPFRQAEVERIARNALLEYVSAAGAVAVAGA